MRLSLGLILLCQASIILDVHQVCDYTDCCIVRFYVLLGDYLFLEDGKEETFLSLHMKESHHCI